MRFPRIRYTSYSLILTLILHDAAGHSRQNYVDEQICIDSDALSDDTGLFLSDSDGDISDEEESTADSGYSIVSSRFDTCESVGDGRKVPCSGTERTDSSRSKRRFTAPTPALKEDFRALLTDLLDDFGASSKRTRVISADQRPS